MGLIKVGIIGIGNCASSLVQCVEFLKKNFKSVKNNFGILHPLIGKYKIENIEFVAAFDVAANKVGRDLSEGIFAFPNCASKFYDVPNLGIDIYKGPILDGLSANLRKEIKVAPSVRNVDVASKLIENDAELLINFLPTGSIKASNYYAHQALEANCGFINAIPELIASNPDWSKKFLDENLPLVGDDVKSQIGGTIIHRALIDLFNQRGVKIIETSQSNFGGNADYLNLSDKSRFKSKLHTKETAIRSLIPNEVFIDMPLPIYQQELGDSRICKIFIDGRYFGNTPISLDLNIKIEDSPDASGVIVDLIRIMKLALERGESGVLHEICPFYFKHPPIPCDDKTAYQKVKNFIEE